MRLSPKRRIALNVLWNWSGMAVGMLTGFLVAPFLVGKLGQTGYGLWVLIASLCGYCGLLDIGVRGSLGRNMAYYRARGDRAGVNAMLTTALAMLCVPAVLTLLGIAALQSSFHRMFDVPAEQIACARIALWLVGINLTVNVLLSVFDATLWSLERFDLINAVDIPVSVLRLGLPFLLIDEYNGLEVLAWITLACTLASGLGKAVLCLFVDRSLRLGRAFLTVAAARTLLGFGFWSWLLSVTRMIRDYSGPLIIGSRLGVGWVTPFSIASSLTGRATALLIAGSGVLTPMAASLEATDQRAGQRRMVIEGGKYCWALSLFFLSGFLLLGDAFIALWMHGTLAEAYPLLAILAVGEALPLGLWVGVSLLVGMGRHGVLACVSLLENIVVVVLGILLTDAYGPVGVCVALAVGGFLFRGVFQLVYLCRTVQLPLRRYIVEALVPPVLAAAPPALGLCLTIAYRAPESWFDLFSYTAGFAVASADMGIAVLAGPRMVVAQLGTVRRSLTSITARIGQG
jgi:O-antigen/teichoic acid export membrane protein